MLLQFVTVLQGVLAPALLVMALSVMLTVGEGRDKPLSAYWRLAGFVVGFAGESYSPRCAPPPSSRNARSSTIRPCGAA